MPYFAISAILLLIAYPMVGAAAAVWTLAGSQATLLLREIRTGQVTGAGAFVFMSFLFFTVRPVYILLERDYRLFTGLFLLRADLEVITSAMWWASSALWCFAFGAYMAPRLHRRYFLRRREVNRDIRMRPRVGWNMAAGLVALQLATLPIMWMLVTRGESLYRSAYGAYLYDFPMVLQAVHIFSMLVLLERFMRNKSMGNIALLGFSGVLLLIFTWFMRDVSNFRSFYLTGLLVAVIAVLQRMKPKVGYAWLILPILLLQPFLRYLGEQRGLENEELMATNLAAEVLPDRSLGDAYWNFYRHDGDMNIFDTFVAAKQGEPRFKPYAWSWLYVPFHFVPRALWKGKPEKGVTMDMSFTRGAPYSPGIAGFFLRDGGLLWMLLSMALLGYLISMADWWALTLPRGYLQCCLVGILVVNGMLLSRFFLWQYFYQVLYAAIPCMMLAWFFNRKHSGRRIRHDGRRHAVPADPQLMARQM